MEIVLTAPALVDTDLAEISDIEADLQRRLEMVAGNDDLIVLLGMVVAGEADADVLSSEVADLTGIGQPADKVTRFQQLWYHFKVPFGEASLIWWYLFCLNLGREGDVGSALVRLDRQLAALGPEPTAQLDGLADLLGLSRDSVVITDDELGDVDALASAVRRGVALVWTDDLAAAAAVAKAEPAPETDSAAVPSRWLGPPADLTDSESRVRGHWSELADTERDELLAMLEQKVTSIERMRFRLGDSITNNKESALILGECRAAAPGDWPYSHLVLVTTL